MALIKCQECGKEISDKSLNCIHCGCPISSNNEYKQKKEDEKKENNFTNVIRYIIGLFCLLFVFSAKGIGIILILLAVALILPITSKFIYEKINIPKALKIIIPIVLIIASMVMTPSFEESFEDTTNNNKGNINENNLEKWIKIYASGTIYGGNVFMPIISISPLEKNYTCEDVSFTLDTYISYDGNKISDEKPIQIELNENCKFYSKDEILFELRTNPHASARVNYEIKYVKGTIKE